MGTRILFGASLAILVLLVIGTLFVSTSSVITAYRSQQDHIGQLGFDQIRATPGGGEDAVKAIRGRRATAATWAMAYAILMGWIVLVPYRNKQRWAWWALLVSMGVPQLISLARLPLLGTNLGATTSAVLLAFVLLGLLAGAPRMFSHKIEGLD